MAARKRRQAVLTDELRQVRPRHDRDRKAIQRKEFSPSSERNQKAAGTAYDVQPLGTTHTWYRTTKSCTTEQELLRSFEEEELKKVKDFDLNIKYGPCVGEM